LLLSILMWAVLLGLRNGLNTTTSQVIVILSACSIPVCLCVLRLRLPEGKWWQQWLTEGAFIGVLSCILGVIDILCALVLINHRIPTSIGTPTYKLLVYPVSGVIANGLLFLVLRGGIRIWLLWNWLRRKQLLWSLTHAHVMVVALGAGVMILLIEGVFIVNALYFSRASNLASLVPVTIVLVILSIIALVAVVPPSVLFSYIVMRRTTSRIKTLATATSALRSGNYRVRVPVVGEDEVAQLQADFNAMAATLEQTMQQLREERDTVAGLLQARRQLIVGVSHELRTPVATLRSYLETALMHWETNPPTSLHHDLHTMENEVIRLQGLIEDLFALSRAEVGKLTLRCEPTSISPIVQRAVDARAPLAWQSGRIEVVAHIAPTLPDAQVDAGRLEQVLQNLLHNAVRHTPPGGIVAVRVTTDASALVIEIKDTGEGIATSDIPHIWERFYQANGIQHRGGAGLGLALVKELVEAMNGTITVASTQGEGSCFTMRLPAAGGMIANSASEREQEKAVSECQFCRHSETALPG
ncbi:MAG: HAMP domain-containing sensor histidine kinase, partial [Ktedonobacteraceae bacterium]